MKRRPKRLLALDMGSHSIKALDVSVSGDQLRLNGLAYAEIPADGNRTDVLRRVVHENRFRGHNVVTSVSGRNVIVRYVPMAQMNDAELRSAIRIEADKYIPFGVDEVQLDCARIAEMPTSNEMKVLLVAVKRSLIDEQVNVMREVGLVPSVIDVDAFALGNAFAMSGPRSGDDGVTALVDIGSAKTNITIIQGSIAHFAREVYVAGDDFNEQIVGRLGIDPLGVDEFKRNPGEQLDALRESMQIALDDLTNEIALSFDFFENESEKMVSEIYLSGGGVIFPGIEEIFAQQLGKPTFLWNPAQGIDSRVGGQAGAKLQADPSQFAICVGLAARALR